MEIVPFHIRYLEDLLILYQRLSSATPQRLAQIFKWKHIANPVSDQPLVVVAIDSGEVVGTRNAYGLEWKIGASLEPKKLACFGGTVVRESYEGRGLVSKMTDALFELALEQKFDFGINLSPGPVVAGLSQRRNWLTVGPWDIYYKSGSGGAMKQGLPFSDLDQLPSAASKALGIRLSSGPLRENELAHYCQVQSDPYPATTYKTAEFFKWRLLNPGCEYRVIYADNSELCGYAILGRNRTSNTICILQLSADTDETYAAVVEYIVKAIRHNPIAISSVAIPASLLELLTENQFAVSIEIETAQRPYLLTNFNTQRLSFQNINGVDLTDPDNWDASLLNTDIV